MDLFGLSKKKNAEKESAKCDCGGMRTSPETAVKKAAGCCCGGNCSAETMASAQQAKSSGASVKVLGSGCAKCHALEAATKQALAELHMDAAIDHVTDFAQIASYGVMTTPALVVDGKVVSFGKVLKKEEVKEILNRVRG